MRDAVWLGAVIAALVGAACGAESEVPVEEGLGEPGAGPVEDPSLALTDTAVVTGVPAEDGDPFPDLDEAGRVMTFELSVINQTTAELIVYASAGAARVVLDTIPERDSTRVSVQVRARRLSLEAAEEDGRTVRQKVLDLIPAGPNRWVIRSGDG